MASGIHIKTLRPSQHTHVINGIANTTTGTIPFLKQWQKHMNDAAHKSWSLDPQQIDTLVFRLPYTMHHSIWEWLINSPYEVRMESASQIEFLDPAGAVAFKLMFVKGPRDDASSDHTT